MKKNGILIAILVISALTGCGAPESEYNIAYVSYQTNNPSVYRSGYTEYSYTAGYEDRGLYDSGYGPAFWNPRYVFYTAP